MLNERMAEATTKNYGKELLGWEVPEYHAHARGAFWYVAAAVIVVGLLIWAVSTRNFLFAFIVIMFVVIFVTHSLRPPVRYTFGIYELGIRIGSRFYPFKDIAQFWVAYEPPTVKTLYFDFGGLRPRLAVSLENVNPNEARRVLAGVLSEDTTKTDEPLSDWLARVLKI